MLKKSIILFFFLIVFSSIAFAEPISEPLLKEQIVWDLPEIENYFFHEAEWFSNEGKYLIDVRYNGDELYYQRSEFNLVLFSDLNDAENRLNEILEMYDFSEVEIDGNLVLEKETEESAGKARYILWISGTNVLQGWNGDDAGTVIDDDLFDALTKSYLEKYPSTYGCAGESCSIGKENCFRCPDLNEDGTVDNKDGVLFYGCSGNGTCPLEYDLNGDGITSILSDVGCLNEYFGRQSAEIPSCEVSLEDESLESNLTLIYEGNYSGRKFNLYFAGYGYGRTSSSEQFSEDVNNLVFVNTPELKGLLEAEPFRNYRNRFNIYRIDDFLEERMLNCSPTNQCSAWNLIDYIYNKFKIPLGSQDLNSNKIPYQNYVILIFPEDQEDVYLYATGSGGFNGLYFDYNVGNDLEAGITSLFHEYGHGFAGILDEYGLGYTDTIYSYPEGFPGNGITNSYGFDSDFNCDILPGCPTWCNGQPDQVQRNDFCLSKNTEEECNMDVYQENIACVWIDDNEQITNFFDSNCIPRRVDYGNIGTDCIEGAGCYFGCNGLGWRSTYNSLYAGFFNTTYSEYSKGGLYPYNKIQQDRIVKAFESFDSGEDLSLGDEEEQGNTNSDDISEDIIVDENAVQPDNSTDVKPNSGVVGFLRIIIGWIKDIFSRR